MKLTVEQETAEVHVASYNARGYGCALWPRPAPLPPLEVEIAHAVPGDMLLVAMRKKMRGVRKGRLLEVLQPSDDRVAPRCAHASICGGCCWQQVSYEAQLREKQARVTQAFGPHAPLRPIVAAAETFGYRNKMEFTFSENRGGMQYLGLMIAQAEPYVFNLEECHLMRPWGAQALRAVRQWWQSSGLKAYDPPRDLGTLRYLTLREAFHTGQKMAVLNVSGNPEFAPRRDQLEGFVSSFRAAVPGEDPALFLRVHQTKKGRPTRFYEMHLGGPDHIVEELRLRSGTLVLKMSPSSFFQPNTRQAEQLYDAVAALLEPLRPSLVFDLYCGTGTLGMAAARSTPQVVGVELSPEAIVDAEENAQRNGLDNFRFYQGDVGQVLTRLRGNGGFRRPDVVIVDPPRAGLDPLALHQIRTLSPRALIYVSCNPLTQAENIRALQQVGYQIRILQPVDQFPHTHHIENIALLTLHENLDS
jgi:23S rRNA (uracil1939-C5)-methyltransferase